MHPYSHLLFDLDGTLTNPEEGITLSLCYALQGFGIEISDPHSLSDCIGPPLMETLQNRFGFSPSQAEACLARFRERFSHTGLYENTVYPGILELLRSLRTAGKTLILATSKPEPFARRILSHFGLLSYFSFVGAASMDASRVEKQAVIAHVLSACPSVTPQSAVMIGDRRHDVMGAAQHGIDCIGVTYGFGSREELLTAGAIALADSPAALGKLLLGSAAR